MDLKHPTLLLLLMLSITMLSYSQLGEIAGQPTLNVSVGSSTTFNYSILNAGSSPINFTVILPTLNTIPHNTTPTVSITPMKGILAPHSQKTISIRVFVPRNDKPGLKWQGIVQVVEVSSHHVSSGGMGATITAGVAKILTIYSVAPKPFPWIYYVIILVAIVVAVVLIYLAFARQKKLREIKAAEARALAKRMKVAARRKAKKAVVKARKKPPAKKKAKKKAKRRPAKKPGKKAKKPAKKKKETTKKKISKTKTRKTSKTKKRSTTKA